MHSNTSVLGGRFVIEQEVGRGGAGIVYRAFDHATEQVVALKVLASEAGMAPVEEARLTREAEVLRSLDHPGIVKIVASGELEDSGAPFVAMEWLTGCDLDTHRRRVDLSLPACVELGIQVARALEAAHDTGIVHRDVKPGNIFMCESQRLTTKHLDAVPKLVDFGIAASESLRVTTSGDILGTPAYMAPEQARGDAPIDARCDLYSLGATLFELIAHRPPHVGPTAIATLARLVTTPPPHLRELRRSVPAMLDSLIHRMLSLDPMDRPGSAQEVVESLQLVLPEAERSTELPELGEAGHEGRLGTSAKRLVTSMVALRFPSSTSRDRALEMLRQRGADAAPLGPEALVAHFGAQRTVGTEALAALDLGRRLARAGAQVGIASGQARVELMGHSGLHQPVGEVVDRASALARDARADAVLADATTSELGRGRYEFRSRNDGSSIVGEPVRGMRGEQVGGAPFVGREPELAQIISAFERAMLEPTALLVSVTGAPGIGKSRLRREVLARISAQATPARVVLQRSEAYGRSHALGAATDALRSLFSLPKGASIPETERAIVEQLGPSTRATLTSSTRNIIARLLTDETLPEGVDPRGARDVLWLAMTDLVLEVVGHDRTVLIMEDMQWADAESVDWLDHLIGRAARHPLLVIALMRPEFWEQQGSRFAGRDHVRIALRPISRRATRAIAKSLLGDKVSEDVLDQIAERAAGLPLFAEELSRLAHAGGDTATAPTIQAAIQSSLDALSVEARDALGRLSVFGLSCWDAGLEALGMTDAESKMKHLAAAEVLLEQLGSRFSGSREWVFKHSLVRDVVYASLGETERKELHALAASWLASMGEDAAVVARHHDLGGQHALAADFWARAARRALATNALSDALKMAERALAFAETKESAFKRASYLDEAWSRLDPRASDRESALIAMEDSVYDQASALRARGARARYDQARGAGEQIAERLAATRDEAASLGMHEEEARCAAELASRLAFGGQLAEAEAAARHLLELAESRSMHAAAVDGWQTLAIVRQTKGALSSALDARRAAVSAARAAGLREREAMLTTNLGFALTTIGARQEARSWLESGLELALAIGSRGAVRHTEMNLLGWTATFGNDQKLDALLAEVRADADASADGIWTAPDRSNLGVLFYRGSELLRAGGRAGLERARKLLRSAAETYRSTGNRDVLPVALGRWASAEHRCGNTQLAIALALEASQLLDGGAPSLLNEASVYRALHDAYLDDGDEDAARNAVERCVPALLRRVRGLVGTPYARFFVTELPDNAAVIAAAEDYGIVLEEIQRILEKGSS